MRFFWDTGMIGCNKKNELYEKLIVILLFWLVLQDFVLALFYNITNQIFLTNLLFYSKDILLIVLFFWCFVRGVTKKLFYLTGCFFVCLAITFFITLFITDTEFKVILQNIRGIILLPCYVCIGFSIKSDASFIKSLKEKFFSFLLVCAVIGIVEYFLDKIVGTKDFWVNTVGIGKFLTDIKDQSVRLYNGLPGNFYGQYGNDFFSVKRLVGLWMNPLTAAYLMALPFSYYGCAFLKSKNYFILIKVIILGLAIYFTHTRAIILLLAVSFILYLLFNPSKNNMIILGIIAVVGIVLIGVFFEKIMAIMYDGSTIGHINGIVTSLSKMNYCIFGNGFSYAGIIGDLGTESQYITVLGNIGIAGLIFYLIFLIYPLVIIKRYSNRNIFLMGVFYVGICYTFSGIISEQLSAYTTIAPYYIVLGFSLKLCYSFRNNNKIPNKEFVKQSGIYGNKEVCRHRNGEL